MTTLGDNIRAERNRRRLTAHALAKLAGVSDFTVLAIERNEINPRIGTVQKIAAAMGISVDSLLLNDAAPTSPRGAVKAVRSSSVPENQNRRRPRGSRPVRNVAASVQ